MTALSQKKGTTQSEGCVDALKLDASWWPGAKGHSASGRQCPHSVDRCIFYVGIVPYRRICYGAIERTFAQQYIHDHNLRDLLLHQGILLTF